MLVVNPFVVDYNLLRVVSDKDLDSGVLPFVVLLVVPVADYGVELKIKEISKIGAICYTKTFYNAKTGVKVV